MVHSSRPKLRPVLYLSSVLWHLQVQQEAVSSKSCSKPLFISCIRLSCPPGDGRVMASRAFEHQNFLWFDLKSQLAATFLV